MMMARLRMCMLGLLLCAALSACNRSEPTDGSTTPPNTPLLTPIAQYDISANVREPSGVVHDPRRHSLLVVSDSHPDVVELRFDGSFIRTITTTSTDLEGISLSATGDTMYISEERTRRVVLYQSSGAALSSFSADVATLENNALEGVTVGRNGNLFVLNEKQPGMILEYTPAGTEIRRMTLSLALDYSDIMYDATANCLWIISDESARIMKTDMNGSLVAQWSLPFTKGEGIAIVQDTMYVVNDADAKLYVFLTPR